MSVHQETHWLISQAANVNNHALGEAGNVAGINDQCCVRSHDENRVAADKCGGALRRDKGIDTVGEFYGVVVSEDGRKLISRRGLYCDAER